MELTDLTPCPDLLLADALHCDDGRGVGSLQGQVCSATRSHVRLSPTFLELVTSAQTPPFRVRRELTRRLPPLRPPTFSVCLLPLSFLLAAKKSPISAP